MTERRVSDLTSRRCFPHSRSIVVCLLRKSEPGFCHRILHYFSDAFDLMEFPGWELISFWSRRLGYKGPPYQGEAPRNEAG